MLIENKDKGVVRSPNKQVWFTADTHFSHANIIRYSGRPFKTIQEMDETLINNWNSVVKPNDDVYHLGDFAFKGNDIKSLLAKLNGFIYFIWGNHDQQMKIYKSTQWDRSKIMFLGNMHEIELYGQNIVLNHYAMRIWNKSHFGAYHIYGHSHGSLPDDPNSRSFDVGVDCHNYRPISYAEVEDIMDKKVFVPIDHHGRRDKTS